jgi:hypothetical protein
MLSTCHQPLMNSYRVEVSGWDSSHAFFVEKSELIWNEESGKRLTLTRSLLPGTMIFVRLLQTTMPVRSISVAYKAEQVTTTPEGHCQFRLHQAEPVSIPEEISQ